MALRLPNLSSDTSSELYTTETSALKPRYNEVSNDCTTRRQMRTARGIAWTRVISTSGDHYHYYWAEEYHLLYRGLRYLRVCYIGVQTFYYYRVEEYRPLYRVLRYTGFRYIGVPMNKGSPCGLFFAHGLPLVSVYEVNSLLLFHNCIGETRHSIR